jgi:hypothetical protein
MTAGERAEPVVWLNGQGPGTLGRTLMAERVSQRNADAVRLRAEGWSYQRIAEELGFADSDGAYQCVQAGLRAVVREPTEVAVHLELTGLNEMSRAVWAVLRRDHVIVSQGRVVTRDGKPVPDDGPILAAIDRLLKIQERRARLLGLDAPLKSRIGVITEDMVDAEIRRLEDELAGRSRGHPAG